jgi:sulfate adenylyltransferase subunit 1 (EFTu-like GTPase family)
MDRGTVARGSAGCTQRPLQAGKKYFLKHTTQTVQAVVTQIESRINFDTLEPEPAPATLAMNDIGGIRIKNRQTAGLMTVTPPTG